MSLLHTAFRFYFGRLVSTQGIAQNPRYTQEQQTAPSLFFPVSSSVCKNTHVDIICRVIHWGNKRNHTFCPFYVHILIIIFTLLM